MVVGIVKLRDVEATTSDEKLSKLKIWRLPKCPSVIMSGLTKPSAKRVKFSKTRPLAA